MVTVEQEAKSLPRFRQLELQICDKQKKWSITEVRELKIDKEVKCSVYSKNDQF